MAGNHGGDRDHTMDFMVVAGLIMCVGFGIYTYKPEWLLSPWRGIRLAETWLLGFLPMTSQARLDINTVRAFLQSHTAQQLTLDSATKCNQVIWQVTRFPYSLILVILAIFQFRRTPPARTHTMESLIEQESKIRPHLRIFKYFRPEQIANNADNPFRSPEKPLVFAKRNRIVVDKTFNAKIAADVFSSQLGRTFNGLDNLNRHFKWLAAVFIANIAREPKNSDILSSHCCDAYARPLTQKYYAAKADKMSADILKRHGNNEDVLAVIRAHHHEICVLMGLLEVARQSGILSSTKFPWLAFVDRTTWSALHDMGSDAFSSEVAGIASHYRAEEALKRPFLKPKIHGAVTGLKSSLITYGEIPADPVAIPPPSQGALV